MLLPNLNSIVNPWVYLAFNRNLWYTLLRLLLGVKGRSDLKHRHQHSCTNQNEFNSSVGYSEHSQNTAINLSPASAGAQSNALRVRGPRSTGNVNSIVTTARSSRPLLRDAFRRDTYSASESRSSECSCGGRESSLDGRSQCCHVADSLSRADSNNNNTLIKKSADLKTIEVISSAGKKSADMLEDKVRQKVLLLNSIQSQSPHQLQRSSSYARHTSRASFDIIFDRSQKRRASK